MSYALVTSIAPATIRAQPCLDNASDSAQTIAAATPEQLEDLRMIVGGLPETFTPYREALHRYVVVDHATAFTS